MKEKEIAEHGKLLALTTFLMNSLILLVFILVFQMIQIIYSGYNQFNKMLEGFMLFTTS